MRFECRQVSAMLLRERIVEHADPHGHGNPPTYIRQNGLTGIIQEVIDTSARRAHLAHRGARLERVAHDLGPVGPQVIAGDVEDGERLVRREAAREEGTRGRVLFFPARQAEHTRRARTRWATRHRNRAPEDGGAPAHPSDG